MKREKSEGNASAVYDRLGEFHDLFMDEPWERLRPVISQAFKEYGPGQRIVDLGAGSGLGIRVLAAETRARLTALEPSLVMRAILTARTADDVELRDRVTVVAGSIPHHLHSLPQLIDGVVCANMLGHLEPQDRQKLFSWINACLTPHGTAIITVQTDDNEPGLREPFEERRTLGDYEYKAIYRQSSQHHHFSSRYEVRHRNALVRAEEYEGRWYTVTLQDVRTELDGLDLTASTASPNVLLIRRP